MIIPSRSFGVVASSRRRAVVANDVTPNAVNWVESISGSITSTSNQQTITGINTTITLRIQVTNTLECGEYAYYIKNSGSYVTVQDNCAFPAITYADVSVVSGDVLEFRLDGVGNAQQAIFNITNLSDGNTLLDTVTLNIVGV